MIITVLLTIFVTILVPVYYKNYGLANFLWFSDIGLFLTLIALWLNSKLLMSVAILGILPLELFWNIDFFLELLTGYSISGISHYMLDDQYSYGLRALSLFHVFMPIIWLYYLKNWGYAPEALIYWLRLFWVVLFLSYLFSSKQENINWVYVPSRWASISRPVWLILLSLGLPAIVFLPLHLIFKFLA